MIDVKINIFSLCHKLVIDQMTTKKKVVKVVSFGLSPIGEKYPQTKEKPKLKTWISFLVPKLAFKPPTSITYKVTPHKI